MKVLFIDTVHPVLQEKMEEYGFTCEDGTEWSEEKINEHITEYGGIVLRSRIRIGREFLEKAKNLKFVARSGSGVENIDAAYCEAHNIAVFNSPEGNRDAVAEHIMGMLLSLFNRLVPIQKEIKDGRWLREANSGIELMGKTVGIIGYGNNGAAFAKKLSGFDCKILAYDKYKSLFSHAYVKESALEEIYEQADIISFHVPQTEETIYYFDDEFMNAMEKNFYLINASRGAVVRIDSLVEGLKSGKILGACLDVLEYEKFSFEEFMALPPPDDFHYLVDADNVLLSPHIAGWTRESYYKLSMVLWKKIERWLAH